MRSQSPAYIMSALIQTCMFVALFLYTARMEDRITARLASVEVALLDLRHQIQDQKEVKP